jgi:hypothetical protein
MIDLRFERLRLDGNDLRTDWDLLLRLVADFSIVIPHVPFPLYRGEEFCVVEFAMQMTQWLADIDRDPRDFSYDSMESDEAGLVSIRKREHGWALAALNQDYVEDRQFSLEEIRDAVSSFVARLKTEVRERFGRDIGHLVSGGRVVL